jgi:hypothetical protein
MGASICRAQPVGLGSFGLTSVKENFDAYPNGTILNSQVPGAAFENARTSHGWAISQPSTVTSMNRNLPLVVRFEPAVLRVGVNWDGDGACCNRQPTMNVYDSQGMLIGSHATGACCVFWGYQNASGISRVEFTYPGGGSGDGYDNLIFEPLCPLITRQPASASVCATGAADFVIAPAGVGPFTYQWQYESATNVWFDATNGPVPYSSGTITASNVTTDQLQVALNTTQGAPPIRFRCIVTNSCGSATSEPATLAPCQSDFTCDGQVDDADFVGFAAAYNILDCAEPAMPVSCPADLNGDGFVEDADFVVFVAAYNELGC